MTLQELQDMRAALVAARSRGLREVRDSTGESVSYKTDAEMAAALRALDAEMAAQQRGGRSSVIRFTTSKGL
jgi:CO/xanthine dehydrogenase FAD-binding subunit